MKCLKVMGVILMKEINFNMIAQNVNELIDHIYELEERIIVLEKENKRIIVSLNFLQQLRLEEMEELE
tara:strand:- start:174 stop:377 length:204 start_codon:yes stop_codon:yes gene_type:complete